MILQEKIAKKQPLFSITNRFIIFLFGFALIVFTFYLCGQWSNFLDSSLKLLLTVESITTAILLLFLIFEIVYQIVNICRFKSLFYLKYIAMYVLFFIFTLVLFVVSMLMNFVSL